MNFLANPVYVLGAGFTKAYVDNAPLMVDHYEAILELHAKYPREQFPHANAVLRSCTMADERIDVEQLMTRLDSQMPYDVDGGASDELSLLLSDVKRAFVTTIEAARQSGVRRDALRTFAAEALDRNATLITFNYDDILDSELYATGLGAPNRWTPDAGYGFRCEPSLSSVRGGYDTGRFTADAPLLLKLHGSMNWRTKRGYASPYVLDAIVHHEDWFEIKLGLKEEHYVSLHIQPDPFIVPPILAKSDVAAQPVLRLVWSLAFRALKDALRIVFVGYSMPVTDIAAKFLFREAIPDQRKIRVVNLVRDASESTELERCYRNVFPDVASEHFDYGGALAWGTSQK